MQKWGKEDSYIPACENSIKAGAESSPITYNANLQLPTTVITCDQTNS